MGTDYRKDAGGAVQSPLDVAEAGFRLLACEPGGLALDCAALSDLPRRTIGLVELRDLICAGSVSGHVLDCVWRQLAVRARECGPAWVVGAVGMALPSLRVICGALTRGYVAGDPRDIDTEVLVAFLEALKGADLQPPNVRPRLCAAAKRAGEHARRVAESGVARRLPPRTCITPRTPWSHPDFVLADAVAKGVVSGLDAEIIGRTRLEEQTLVQAANELGLSPEAAKKRRQRAEPILCAAVRAGQVQADMSLTITSSPPRGVEPTTSARGRDTSHTASENTDVKGGPGAGPGSARSPLMFLPGQGFGRVRVGSAGGGMATEAPTRQHSRPLSRGAVRVVLAVTLTVLVVALVATDALAAKPPTNPDDLTKVFDRLRDWLVGLLAALATLMLTIGGLRYLLAGADPGEVHKSKAAFKAAAIGYALAVLAPLVVNLLKRVVGQP